MKSIQKLLFCKIINIMLSTYVMGLVIPPHEPSRHLKLKVMGPALAVIFTLFVSFYLISSGTYQTPPTVLEHNAHHGAGKAGRHCASANPRIAFEGSAVTLSASRCGISTTGSYLWIQTHGPSVQLTNRTAPLTTFIAPHNVTTLGFQLTARDNTNKTNRAYLFVDVISARNG